MPRILLSTYSAETHSSYGIVTRELWRRLRQMHPDWEIKQHGWMHTSAEKVDWEIWPTRKVNTPQGPTHDPQDRYGQLSFETYVARFKPDLVWTVADLDMCSYMGEYRSRYGFKLIKHIAIDGAPLPPQLGSSLDDCDEVVPVTKFGARAMASIMKKQPGEPIYHGVDVERFVPAPEHRQERPMAGTMNKDTFLLTFVGHSQWRKQNWNMFKVIRFMREGAFHVCLACDRVTLDHWDDITSTISKGPSCCVYCRSNAMMSPGPQNIALWYHTFDRSMVDINPERMKKIWGVQDSIIGTRGQQRDEGQPDTYMPQVYQIADAYISLSGGEGFNIPLIEAMASGLPVIYTDYSGQAEVGAYGGLPVRYLELQPQARVGINRAIADVSDAIHQIYRLMTDKKLYAEISAKGLRAARDVFSWDLIAQQWSKRIEKHLASTSIATLGTCL